MTRSTFVVHYSEVALKGKNRPDFVRVLKRNLRRAILPEKVAISQKDGRLFLEIGSDPVIAAGRIAKVFGVAWFAQVTTTEPDYEMIEEKVLGIARTSLGESFKVDARRSDKSLPLSSQELARKLGKAIVEVTGKKVNLDEPDTVFHVDLIKGRATIYSAKQRGPGGLPVGTAGRVIHLFSGGIDSPVAAWLLMKRGCTPVYLHFYLAPTPKTPIESKVTRLVEHLASYQGRTALILVPFAEYQLATVGRPGELEPSLFRRFMRMTAEAIAPAFNATGISTGDSLSQAASQTLWNLASFDSGSTMSVLRPLLTYDKDDVIALARKIETYETSLEDYKDCCAMISNHARTRTKPAEISEQAARLGFKDLVWRALDGATLVTYDPLKKETKSGPLNERLHGRSPLSPRLNQEI